MTFVRQVAHLWAIKERFWCLIRGTPLPYDPSTAIIDGFPLPACQLARACRCLRFKGQARYGKDNISQRTFYGFPVPGRLTWPDVITHLYVAPANVHEDDVLELTAGAAGLLLGDRN